MALSNIFIECGYAGAMNMYGDDFPLDGKLIWSLKDPAASTTTTLVAPGFTAADGDPVITITSKIDVLVKFAYPADMAGAPARFVEAGKSRAFYVQKDFAVQWAAA